MSAIYEELAGRIRGEVVDLERIAQRALQAWAQVQRTAGEQAYVDSAALNLHSFYSGLERLSELIARQVDSTVPTSATWHRDLLQQMAQDVEEVRPAVSAGKGPSGWGFPRGVHSTPGATWALLLHGIAGGIGD